MLQQKEQERASETSEVILRFAEPLFEVTGEPRDIDDLRNALRLATLCWNLPVFEEAGDTRCAELKRELDEMLRLFPGPVVAVLVRMIMSRRTKYADAPYYVVAEARGTTLDDCQIYVEARSASTTGS